MDRLLYGAAYYEEYLPYDRLDQDVEMMKAAGINVVRIAESTWSTCEPQEGVFDFSHVTRVLDAMEAAGISVIIGTPTYAVPAWMVKSYPEILVTTREGRALYGPRQIMDITHPVFRYYAERVIRRLMEVCADRKCVIGYQLDNETKYYGTAGENVQRQFVKYLQKKFDGSLDAMNKAFGLDYWSNRVDAWEDFPDVRNTINGSLGAEFEKFRRTLVDEYLAWQAAIVKEYARDDQFLTHNFDFEWRGFSYGIQPDVNHKCAAAAVTVAGCDIYHPAQKHLTGKEIAFCGAVARSLKRDNYLVLETQAQGFPAWMPYDGQLRLQAYSHLSCGANMVEYWHWHSLHNACETYWKGLLSHDFKENETYRAAVQIGREFSAVGSHLVNLKKHNRAAFLVSNEALTALKWFPVTGVQFGGESRGYNDVVRFLYDRFYEQNIECDIVWPEDDFDDYRLLVAPALYAASEELLKKIERFVEKGGHLLATFKTAFADENVKVYPDCAPHILNRCLGISYSHFTVPDGTALVSDRYACEDRSLFLFMELVNAEGAEVLASYDTPGWSRYAAVTRNHYGEGCATYLACWPSEEMAGEIVADVVREAELWGEAQEISFPISVRTGTNDMGKEIIYYLNYSGKTQDFVYRGAKGTELLTGTGVEDGQSLCLEPWGLKIIER